MHTTELYDLWTEILPYYRPTHGRLVKTFTNTDEDHFCCLGVACQISNLGNWFYEDYFVIDNGQEYNDDCNLPTPVMTALGLKDENGAFDWQDLSLELQNDLNAALLVSAARHMDPETIEEVLGSDPITRIESLAHLNDELFKHPNVFGLIQRVLREKPDSLFR